MPNIIHSSGFWRSTKPPPGSQINWDHPLSKGLVGCWLMNEGAGSITRCLVSPSNNGNLTNGARFKDNGVYTDGINDRIVVPNFGNVLDGKYLTAFVITSVVSWSPGVFPRFVDRIYDGQFCVYANASYKILGFSATSSAGPIWLGTFANHVIPTGKITNIAVTWNGSRINAWLNTIKSPTSFTGPGLASSTSELSFGNRAGINSANNCILYSIYLWPFALSNDAILALNQDPYCFILPPTVRRYFSPLATPLYAPDAAPAKARSVVKISRDQKPPIGSQINWDHPLSKGLVGCWLFNGELRNLTGRRPLKQFGRTPFVDNGIQVGTSDNDYLSSDDPVFNFSSNYSFVCSHKPIAFNSTGGNFLCRGKYAVDGYYMGGGWGAVVKQIWWTKITAQIHSTIDCFEIGKTNTITWTHLGSVMRIYFNNAVVASGTSNYYPQSNRNLLIGRYEDAGYAIPSILRYLYIYNRGLTSAEVKLLNEDPYCLITIPDQIFYSSPPRRIFTPLALLQPPPRPTSWALRAITGGNRPTLWHDRQEIADQQATTWHDRQEIHLDHTASWNDREIIAGDRDAGWRVRMKVEDDRTAEWQVREVARSDRTATWHYHQLVALARALTWKAYFTLSRNLATTWNDLETKAYDRSTTWDTCEIQTCIRDLIWNDLETKASGRSTTWADYQQAFFDRATGWSLNETIPSSQATTWNVWGCRSNKRRFRYQVEDLAWHPPTLRLDLEPFVTAATVTVPQTSCDFSTATTQVVNFTLGYTSYLH